MENPYAPPSATVEDVETSAGSPVKAVAIGLLIDIGGTTLAGIVLVAIYAFSLAQAGVDESGLVDAMMKLPNDSWVSVAGMVIGCLFSILGGYVCARIAKGSAQRAGHIMAASSVASSLLFGVEGYSLLMQIVSAVATFASVMGGVYLGRIRNRPTPKPSLADVASREPG